MRGSFVVYGDTDSVMVRLPRDRFPTLGAAWEEGDRLAGIISGIFREPHDLEMEEIKWPFLLTDKKKTYAARAWEPAKGGGFAPHVLIKGLDPVRKDRVKVSRDLVTSVLESLLGSGTQVEPGDKVPEALSSDAESRAARQVAATIDAMVNDELSLDKFVLSRSTRSSYKDKESNVAPMVRERMIERGDPEVPPIGARVAYVITTRGGPGAKQAVAADSPAWFAENGKESGLRLNVPYYINLLRNPLGKILQYTSIPVDRILDVGVSSQAAESAACVLGAQSKTRTGPGAGAGAQGRQGGKGEEEGVGRAAEAQVTPRRGFCLARVKCGPLCSSRRTGGPSKTRELRAECTAKPERRPRRPKNSFTATYAERCPTCSESPESTTSTCRTRAWDFKKRRPTSRKRSEYSWKTKAPG